MKTLIIFWFLLSSTCGTCQLSGGPVMDGYVGMGAYTLQQGDVFSFTANQAALAALSATSIGVATERKFLLADLNNNKAVGAFKMPQGNFAVETNYGGLPEYNETKLGLAYAKTLGAKLSVGLQFNYHGIRIAGYGKASAITVESGVILHLSDKLHTGLHLDNPFGGKFNGSSIEQLPSVYTMAIGYESSDKVAVSLEIKKQEDQRVNVQVGMQYKVTPQCMIRAGFYAVTSSFWLGAGITWKNKQVHLVTSYHSYLGVSPALVLIMAFKKERYE